MSCCEEDHDCEECCLCSDDEESVDEPESNGGR